MTTTTDKLLGLAQVYEDKARGLRMAAAELNGHETAKKQAKGIGGVIDHAIALRRQAAGHETTNGDGAHENGDGRRGRTWSPEQRAKFQRSMAKINRKKRAALAAHDAPAQPPAKKKPRPWKTGDALKAQRLESARLLAAFDPKEPRTGAAAGLTKAEIKKIGPLLRGGYLKTKGDGMILTAKSFVP